MTNCVVCKQPISDGEVAIKTAHGDVHAGQCQAHLSEMAVTESSGEQQLQETQLLNG